MTNNLKILTILSIFVLILTGYFCFSSSFAKNQTIANNNKDNKEITNINNEDINNNTEKDNEDTNINNEDSDNNEEKDNSEKTSNLSILSIIVLIVILIIVIVVIVFIIVNFNKSKSEIKEEPEVEVEFNIRKDSKEDFKKENFCPTFFLISHSLLKEKCINVGAENGENFFKALAEHIFYRFDREVMNKMNKVIISLDIVNADSKFSDDEQTYNTSLGTILGEIAEFAAFTKNVKDFRMAVKITDFGWFSALDFYRGTDHSKLLEQKYYKEFDSYLCSYLLRYLAEEIANKNKNVEIKPNNIDAINAEKTIDFRDKNNNITVSKNYYVDYTVMDKILDKLLNDKPFDNMKYGYS